MTRPKPTLPNVRSANRVIHKTCVQRLILRKILSSPEPLDLTLWTRSGEIQHWHRCISLHYDFYKGTRRMKLLDSNEIRQLRDVCVCEVNGMEVFL